MTRSNTPAPLPATTYAQCKRHGTGMTEEVKARLFEAFFTTKPWEKELVWGWRRARRLSSNAEASSMFPPNWARERPSKFIFRELMKPIEAVAKTIPAGPSPRGTESMLIVEDDQSVRHLACTVLAANGYEVHSAANGQDALNVANEHQGSADPPGHYRCHHAV